ncbi:hypothetical protein BDY21DRAFT_186012 [Lineolata rhizophorae]|uniref:Uncharacterized protein n=1 Tax=Lineolata rhizophorae TaxID=578093 RepID=A0A6A6P8L5_9PEZI|nr:hypothetical protein BDY21DRAFT_186012 [Lineolata rhizophorae]
MSHPFLHRLLRLWYVVGTTRTIRRTAAAATAISTRFQTVTSAARTTLGTTAAIRFRAHFPINLRPRLQAGTPVILRFSRQARLPIHLRLTLRTGTPVMARLSLPISRPAPTILAAAAAIRAAAIRAAGVASPMEKIGMGTLEPSIGIGVPILSWRKCRPAL